jgi:hypothetical protein
MIEAALTRREMNGAFHRWFRVSAFGFDVQSAKSRKFLPDAVNVWRWIGGIPHVDRC